MAKGNGQVIFKEDIERLEGRFGADHVSVKGKPRKGKPRFDDETPTAKQVGKERRNQKPAPETIEIKEETVKKPTTATTVTTTATQTTRPAPAPQTQTSRPSSPNQGEMESCPVCGYRKPKEITIRNRDGGESKVQPLVCKGCSDRYHAYAAGPEMIAKLAAGEQVVVLTRHQWVLNELDLARFAQELAVAATEKDRLNGVVQARIKQAGFLPRDTFFSLREKLQTELLPGEKITARDAYGRFRRFEERLKAARTVRPQVEKMVVEETARNSAK